MQVVANGIAIEVDDQGPTSGEPLLLIMGLGMQLIGWPDDLVQLLVQRGFRVIRFDNRDAGLSQSFDSAGTPSLAWSAVRHTLHMAVRAPYALADMAADAVGVLDALHIQRAHVCGASMGGMIAQHMAAAFPDRVKSLTLMMTTTGARSLPTAQWQVQRALMGQPAGQGVDAIVDHLQHVLRVIGSPAYPAEPAVLRARLRTAVQRAWRPTGTARQLVTIAADADRSPLVGRIKVPTQVIHGEADPLVPVAAGRDLVQRIRGAQGDFVNGMGHDLPVQLLPRFADAMRGCAQRAWG